MSEKKKLLVIGCKKLHGASFYAPNNDQIFFAYINKSEDGTRQLATNFMQCREYVSMAYHSFIKNENGAYHIFGSDFPLDMDTLRLLVMTSPSSHDKMRENIFNAKAVLNIIENFFEFESTSKISTVKLENGNYKAWLFTGPKEWLMCPQMLSIYTLVVRLLSKVKIEADNFDAVEESFRRIAENADKIQGDSYFLRNLWDKLYVLLKFRKEIFQQDFTINDAYSLNEGVAKEIFRSNCGVTSFVNNGAYFSDYCKEATDRYKRLVDVHLPRENPLYKSKTVPEPKKTIYHSN